MCHLILALPVIALPVFWLLPWGGALTVYGLVLVATGIVYGLIRKAMKMPPESGAETLMNAAGRVRSVDGRNVMVWIKSELWSAEIAGDDLAVGDTVTVEGIDGLRLRVRRTGPASSQNSGLAPRLNT